MGHTLEVLSITAMSWTTRVQFLAGAGASFSSLPHPDWLWDPPCWQSLWITGTLSLGVKLQGHEADHSHPPNAKVRNVWGYKFTIPSVFMAQ